MSNFFAAKLTFVKISYSRLSNLAAIKAFSSEKLRKIAWTFMGNL